MGVNISWGQPFDPITGRTPLEIAGNNPARSSDDLPAPDGATTTSGPPSSKRSTNRPTSYRCQSFPAEKPPGLLRREWGQPRIRALLHQPIGFDAPHGASTVPIVNMNVSRRDGGPPMTGSLGVHTYILLVRGILPKTTQLVR